MEHTGPLAVGLWLPMSLLGGAAAGEETCWGSRRLPACLPWCNSPPCTLHPTGGHRRLLLASSGVSPGRRARPIPRKRGPVTGRGVPATPPGDWLSRGFGGRGLQNKTCRGSDFATSWCFVSWSGMEPSAASGAAPSTDYLDDFLTEFDQVVQDFDKGGEPSQYEQHLEELKRRPWPSSLYDSGIDDSSSGSNGTSPGSSLNSSEEDLNTPAAPSCSTARLGDTQDLEAFIADLDRTLEEM